MNFETEEEAKAYFEKLVAESWSKMKVKKPKKVEDLREKTDPYYAMLKPEKTINSRYTNHWDLDDADYHHEMERIESQIGRYPIGFRHFENFENYRVVHKDSTVEDYHHVMNKQCEFDEFREINKTAFLLESKNPYFKYKFGFPNFPEHPSDDLSPETFVESTVRLFIFCINLPFSYLLRK